MVAAVSRTATGITVSIARDAALVRTVRLVAASFVRRATTAEDFVEEVRLAVGEACALLVGAETNGSSTRAIATNGTAVASPHPPGMVEVSMHLADRLRVVVQAAGSVTAQDPPPGSVDGIEPWALLRGLIDDFEIRQDDGSTVLSMSWALA